MTLLIAVILLNHIGASPVWYFVTFILWVVRCVVKYHLNQITPED